MKAKRLIVSLAATLALVLGAYGIFGGSLGLVSVANAQQSQSGGSGGQTTQVTNQGLLPSEQNTVNIVKKYGPSVVAINVTVKGQAVSPFANLPPQFQQFFQQFGNPFENQPQTQVERAAGSGFVVDSQGDILTNFHVVAGALEGNTTKLAQDATITVKFPDSKKNLSVKVVGIDQDFDLALLELTNKSDLPKNAIPIPLADSSKVQVGQKAIAIGNPFNLSSTVTQGIVSAVQRTMGALVSHVKIPYIQTDANINPGNSGGPLLDSQGQVIGINDEILSPSASSSGQPGSIGIGFAIPSNIIKENLQALEKGGNSSLNAQIAGGPRLGITVSSAAGSVSDYPDSVRNYLHFPDHGVVVLQVAQGGPADKAGIKGQQFTVTANGQQWPAGGDIIEAINGTQVNNVRDLQKDIAGKKAGDTVTLTVWSNGQTKQVKVTLEVVKEQNQGQNQSQSGQ